MVSTVDPSLLVADRMTLPSLSATGHGKITGKISQEGKCERRDRPMRDAGLPMISNELVTLRVPLFCTWVWSLCPSLTACCRRLRNQVELQGDETGSKLGDTSRQRRSSSRPCQLNE